MDNLPNVVIFTGAGVSVGSGLGTFRKSEGALWEKYDLDVVCNMLTFHKNRDEVFKFYNERKALYGDAVPSNGHFVVKKLADDFKAKVITSNVDSLHERAGCTDVTHVHGNMHSMNCISCKHTWEIGEAAFDSNAKCPHCDSTDTKPGIVIFNEMAPEYATLSEYVHRPGVVKVIIGTSLNVLGPWSLGVDYGQSILVDPEPPEEFVGMFDIVIRKKAEDVTYEELATAVIQLQFR